MFVLKEAHVMPKQRVFLVVFFLMLAALLLPPITVSAQNDDAFDLAILDIDSDPSDLRVGQETSFIVTYKNDGNEAVAGDVAYDLLLQVTDEGADQVIGSCRQSVGSDILSSLEANELKTHNFGAECKIIFRSEEEHLVQAVFVDSGTSEEEAFADTYPPLAGEAEGRHVNNGYKRNVAVSPFESNLPDGLGRLFAGLGMFFAVMAIMGVGTEVIIDSIKLLLGMKSKVTSLEALERMEKLMPGQLATLGVNTVSQKQFETLTRNMRRTVVPISQTPKVIEDVQNGNFATLFPHLDKLGVEAYEIQKLRDQLKEFNNVTETQFGSIQGTIEGGIDTILRELNIAILRLDFQQTKFVKDVKNQLVKIHTEIGALTFQNLDMDKFKRLGTQWNALKTLLLHEAQAWSSHTITRWLETQRDDLVALGREQVLSNFNETVAPQLQPIFELVKELGITDRDLKKEAELRLEWALTMLESQATTTTDTYIESLEHLLQGVEERRYETQSPLRKLWRRLRKARGFWGLVGLLLLSIPVLAIIVQIVASFVGEWPTLFTSSPPFIETKSFLWGLLGSSVLIIVGSLFGFIVYRTNNSLSPEILGASSASNRGSSGWLKIIREEVRTCISRIKERITNSSQVNNKNISDFNGLEYIEIFWNWLRGDQNLDPAHFKNPKKFWILAKPPTSQNNDADSSPLTAENAAQIVLKRTDQQKDEDESRQRWFRIISIFVGIGLAYSLQIDAAELLEAAVPGIENTINSVLNIPGSKLSQMIHWQWITPDRNLTAGILLTGFAAAAGSKFWHDRLGQLQAARKGAETAAELVNQAQQVVASIEQKKQT